jgi:hypothetical protein
MADIYLNMVTWKTEVLGGKIREINTDGTDGIGEMKQRIGIALKTHRGEWLFNVDLGLPYLDEIMVKDPNLDQITSAVRAYLVNDVEGVVGVRSLAVSLDRATRIMTWDLDVETTEGITGPFQVTT